MKIHEKESIHPIALSPNISSLEDETKIPLILIYHEKKTLMRRILRLWQYKLDKNFDLTIAENSSLLSSMTAKMCFKMLMKSSADHFQSMEFSIKD